MQKLALLVGANPRANIGGAVIRLYDGLWKLTAQGSDDSTLILERKDSTSLKSINYKKDDNVVVHGNCTVQAFMNNRGNEQYISLFAELVNGNDATTV